MFLSCMIVVIARFRSEASENEQRGNHSSLSHIKIASQGSYGVGKCVQLFRVFSCFLRPRRLNRGPSGYLRLELSIEQHLELEVDS